MSQEGCPPSEELCAWLRLGHTNGLGPVRCRALLQRLGPPEAILDAGHGLVAEALQSRALAHALFKRDRARDTVVSNALRWLNDDAPAGRARPGNVPLRSILVLSDPAYPPRLLDLADPPLLLYCVGDPQWLACPQVGVVGSRNATALGAVTAHTLAASLTAAGWTVTSGMAEGIDTAAHHGALAAGGQPGSTIGVLGTGIDLIYPSRHRALGQDIAARGALISEQPLGMLPLPGNFPRRNRLIAAMAHGVLVVEAAPQSGSLITARLAADLGREVMAVPGSIHSPLARGCNSLIRQGAKLVESADDILSELPPIRRLRVRSPFRSGSTSPSPTAGTPSLASVQPDGQVPARGAGAPAAPLPEVQARMLSAMSADPVMLETLAARQRLPVAGALAALQTLELIGLVQRQLDGSYVRCP